MSENPKDSPPDDLIRMALSDKVTFEEIYKKYGLTEKEVKVIMKTHLKLSSYINWRKRVRQRQYKHRKKFAVVKYRRYSLDFHKVDLRDEYATLFIDNQAKPGS